MFLIAAILSSVMVGRLSQSMSRDQIHILLTCHGYDPYAIKMMNSMAKILSALNGVYNFFSKRGSVCDVKRSDKEEMTQVAAEFLSLSRMGVSVLDLEGLTKSEWKKFTDFANSELFSACPGLEFSVPSTSTIWATVQTDQCSNKANKAKTGRLHTDLISIFDIVIPFSVQHDPLYVEHSVRRLLHTSKPCSCFAVFKCSV